MNELSKLTLLDETKVYLRDDAALHEVSKEIEGNPIEITDGAAAPLVKCVTAITGSQDLHGYDKPWVGGAGKNKLENTATTTTVSGVTFTVNTDGSVLVNGTATEDISFTLNVTIPLKAGTWIFGLPSNSLNSDFRFRFFDENWFAVTTSEVSRTLSADTSCGAQIAINSGVTVNNVTLYPMIRASGTTADYEPYSNICPITAYTEGKIEVKGKNILPMTIANIKSLNTLGTWSGNVYTISSFTFELLTDADGNITGVKCNGTPANNVYLTLFSDTTAINNGSYYLSGGVSSNFAVIVYDGVNYYTSNRAVDKLFTLNNPTDLYARIGISLGTTVSNVVVYPMIRELSTDNTFEPYTSTTHTTTYPSAIYRGSEDVVNGTVTTTLWKQRLKWGDGLGSSVLGDYTRKQYTVPITVYPPNSDYPQLCSCAPYNASFSDDSLHFYINSGNDRNLVIMLPNDTSNDFEFDIVGELATPTTSSVAPTNLPVKSLLGYNHMESTTGDMEIEYITSDYQPLLETTKKQIYEELPFTIKNGKLHVIYNK